MPRALTPTSPCCTWGAMLLLIIGLLAAPASAQENGGLRARGQGSGGSGEGFYIPGMPVPQSDEEGEGNTGGASSGQRRGNRVGAITRVDRSSSGATSNSGASEPSGPPPSQEEIYGGVIPGKRDWHARDQRRRDRHGRRNELTWIGFMPGENGGNNTLFLQTLHEIDYQINTSQDGLSIEVVLANTRAPRDNTRRRLDTRYWPTAVVETQARRSGRRTVVTITLHRAVSHTTRQEDGFLYIELQDAGTAPAARAQGAGQ